MLLLNKLTTIPAPGEIQTKEELGKKIKQLTDTIQKMITTMVPENKPCPLSTRW